MLFHLLVQAYDLNIKKIHGHEQGVITDIESFAFKDNTVLEEFNCKIKSNNIAESIFSGCKNLTIVKEIEGNKLVVDIIEEIEIK